MDELIGQRGDRRRYEKVTIIIESDEGTNTLVAEQVGFWELKAHYDIPNPTVLQEIEFSFTPLQQPDGTYFTYD